MTLDRSRVNQLFEIPDAVAGIEPEIGIIDEARERVRALRLARAQERREETKRARREALALDPLLSIAETAEYLGLSIPATKRIPPAELPFSRISARNDRRYLRADVDAYVERRKVVE